MLQVEEKAFIRNSSKKTPRMVRTSIAVAEAKRQRQNSNNM